MTRAGFFAAVIAVKPTCLTTEYQEYDFRVQIACDVSVFLWPIPGMSGQPLLSSAMVQKIASPCPDEMTPVTRTYGFVRQESLS